MSIRLTGVVSTIKGKKKILQMLTLKQISCKKPSMTKEKLIEILHGILRTDIDLSFLRQLKENEIESLVACIRERIDTAK